MYAHTPPPPPPKPPGSHDVSRMSTPASGPSPPPPPLPEAIAAHVGSAVCAAPAEPRAGAQSHEVEDLGDQWLPKFLEDKSKQDLADILANHTLLAALTHSPQTMHPSLRHSHGGLQAALADNMSLASLLADAERRLAHQRGLAQAQLLSTHALERQWHAKQGEMDHALAPFAPASLYQRLAQGVVEQEGICYALEESFLEGGGGGGGGDGAGLATEREAAEWVRRYREAKKLYYLRQERKERWDEGRVGGWR
ncbi:hypothetical protein N657DRAFT_562267 [Parathielavia appendiculata]|uniref:VPS37 C-terminal domain-containing protein n=1 Tax=Parathielavia appendiculata TaxID=2587402 RepID=A0AAN6UB13_9PEZI|nr:hypothetical protein N657DRAFT_562267 [Parathielavia appendiculata]